MKIKLDDGAYMPTRAHDTDAGFDLYARGDEVVPAEGLALIDTGVYVRLPKKYFGKEQGTNEDKNGQTIQSGTISSLPTVGFLKFEDGMVVGRGIIRDGFVNTDCNESVWVMLCNHGTEDYHVRRGDKIGQLFVVPELMSTLEVVRELDETEKVEI